MRWRSLSRSLLSAYHKTSGWWRARCMPKCGSFSTPSSRWKAKLLPQTMSIRCLHGSLGVAMAGGQAQATCVKCKSRRHTKIFVWRVGLRFAPLLSMLSPAMPWISMSMRSHFRHAPTRARRGRSSSQARRWRCWRTGATGVRCRRIWPSGRITCSNTTPTLSSSTTASLRVVIRRAQ